MWGVRLVEIQEMDARSVHVHYCSSSNSIARPTFLGERMMKPSDISVS